MQVTMILEPNRLDRVRGTRLVSYETAVEPGEVMPLGGLVPVKTTAKQGATAYSEVLRWADVKRERVPQSVWDDRPSRVKPPGFYSMREYLISKGLIKPEGYGQPCLYLTQDDWANWALGVDKSHLDGDDVEAPESDGDPA